MQIVDAVRHILAYIIVVCFPPVLTIWYVAHGFVRSWRRVGLKVTYVVLGMVAVGTGLAMHRLLYPFMIYEFGFDLRLTALSIVFYAGAALIEIQVRKHLTLRTLTGIAELSGSDTGQEMLQEGIYARMRHPRYVSITLGMIAVALFANYLIAYVFIPFFILGIYFVTVLEERELAERFGDAYREYQKNVPRFIPRLGIK